jgi:hypothetical protein
MKEKVVFFTVIIAIAVWAFTVGSRRNSFEWLDHQLARGDLEGEWVLSERSRTSLLRRGHSQESVAEERNSIVLSSNRVSGNLTLFHGLTTNGTVHVVDTSWSLSGERDGDRYRNYLDFGEGTLASYRLHVSIAEGRLVIWNYINDPDNVRDLYELERRRPTLGKAVAH